MYNLIILGSGRSGTSLTAGALRDSGYFMGENLYEPTASNPKGYFEDVEINSINERILSSVLPWRPKGLLGKLPFFRGRLGESQMWMARVPIEKTLVCPDEVTREIRTLTARQPFCFKDPRFSYTLPCWRPFLKDTRFVVVFRDPGDTAESIAKECRERPYLRDLRISHREILESWRLMYTHILKHQETGGTWLFLQYEQLLNGEGLSLLESFSQAAVDRAFADKGLKRSTSRAAVSASISQLYERLLHLAAYQGQ
jgi:Sulfotransferase family